MEYAANNPSNKEELLSKLLLASQKMSALVKVELESLQVELQKSGANAAVILTMASPAVSLHLNMLRVFRGVLQLAGANWLSSHLKLDDLWESFESCMNTLAKRSNIDAVMITALSPLLPIIESFFILHANTLGSKAI